MKQVTRKVVTYTHLFIKTEKDSEGKVQVTGSTEVTLTEKLGPKKVKAFIEANKDKLDSFVLASVTENEQMYGMTLETFLQHATVIDQ